MTSVCGEGTWKFAKILPAAEILSGQKWLNQFLSKRPRMSVTSRGLMPSTGCKSSLLTLAAHSLFCTIWISSYPQMTFLSETKALAHFGLSFANSHRFLHHSASSLFLENIPNFLSPWNILGTGNCIGLAKRRTQRAELPTSHSPLPATT